MKNRRNIIVIVPIALVVLAALVTTFILVKDKLAMQSAQDMSDNISKTNNNGSDTYKKYAALKGEDYDKAFLSNMIVHHESAMNMAEMAGVSAKHQEIKDFAVGIASSQGREVSEMTTWQQQWGFPVTSGHMMTDAAGNATTSMEGMSTMNDELKGLSGDDFDKKFLQLMITHHQDAVDMSKPAEMNAKRQEIKDLAKAIISAQSNEIDQMQQWQKDWGFLATNNSNDSSSMSGMGH